MNYKISHTVVLCSNLLRKNITRDNSTVCLYVFLHLTHYTGATIRCVRLICTSHMFISRWILIVVVYYDYRICSWGVMLIWLTARIGLLDSSRYRCKILFTVLIKILRLYFNISLLSFLKGRCSLIIVLVLPCLISCV